MATDRLIQPTTFLGSETVTLQDVLESGSYEVPGYQRDYSWTEEEVGDLWLDLALTTGRSFNSDGTPVSAPLPHFLGPMVLQRPTADKPTPQIMDGQQRLVTLSALVSVLQEFADHITDPANRTVWTKTLENMLGYYSGGQYVPRISLARDHHHYLKVVCECTTQAQRDLYVNSVTSRTAVLSRLENATRLLHRNVNARLTEPGIDHDQALIQLVRTVLQLTVFLKMTVREPGVAYEVFEGLNARGLDLQQADLIKNRLYALADNQGTEAQVAAAWSKFVEAIEGQGALTLTEYLYFDHLCTSGSIRQSDLYDEVNRHLSKGPGAPSAKDYAERLAKTAASFQQVLDAGSGLGSGATRDITAIRDGLNNQFSLLFVVAGVNRHAFGEVDLERIVGLAHDFAFRRFVIEGTKLGRYSSEVIEASHAYATDPSRTPDDLAIELRKKSEDASFLSAFKDYQSPTNKMGFYILERLENHLASGAGTSVYGQSPSQHLEHIMPKKPGADWSTHSSDPDHDYEEWVQRLGNLLVLEADINGSIKNKGYSYKKSNPSGKDYAHSSMQLPHQLANFEDGGKWKFTSIQKRQEDLANTFALSVWPLTR